MEPENASTKKKKKRLKRRRDTIDWYFKKPKSPRVDDEGEGEDVEKVVKKRKVGESYGEGSQEDPLELSVSYVDEDDGEDEDEDDGEMRVAVSPSVFFVFDWDRRELPKKEVFQTVIPKPSKRRKREWDHGFNGHYNFGPETVNNDEKGGELWKWNFEEEEIVNFPIVSEEEEMFGLKRGKRGSMAKIVLENRKKMRSGEHRIVYFCGEVGSGKSHAFQHVYKGFEVMEVNILNIGKLRKLIESTQSSTLRNNNKRVVLFEEIHIPSLPEKNFLRSFIFNSKIPVVFLNNDLANWRVITNEFLIEVDLLCRFRNYCLFDSDNLPLRTIEDVFGNYSLFKNYFCDYSNLRRCIFPILSHYLSDFRNITTLFRLFGKLSCSKFFGIDYLLDLVKGKFGSSSPLFLVNSDLKEEKKFDVFFNNYQSSSNSLEDCCSFLQNYGDMDSIGGLNESLLFGGYKNFTCFSKFETNSEKKELLLSRTMDCGDGIHLNNRMFKIQKDNIKRFQKKQLAVLVGFSQCRISEKEFFSDVFDYICGICEDERLRKSTSKKRRFLHYFQKYFSGTDIVAFLDKYNESNIS